MKSRIDEAHVRTAALETVEVGSKAACSSDAADLPMTIATPMTDTAPRGRVFDDSARGTIFWEAEHDDPTAHDGLSCAAAESDQSFRNHTTQTPSAMQPTTFGNAFQISWCYTDRLPFYRTRGLRNPWNANREVKIARDGTEVDPTVGRTLISMFEQQARMNTAVRSPRPPPRHGGYVQHVPHCGEVGMMPLISPMPYGYRPQESAQPYGRPN